MSERMAFIYDSRRVQRTDLVTDVSYDRFAVLETLVGEFAGIEKSVRDYQAALEEWEVKVEAAKAAGKRKPDKPPLEMTSFLGFVRTPFAVGFEAQGHPGSDRYRFVAVNAHLLYGDSELDRQLEGEALARWLIGRAREVEGQSSAVALFCDMNLDYDDPEKDVQRIAKTVDGLNQGKTKVELSFPFLFAHPSRDEVFRTNVSLSQTYDQIGILTTDERARERLATTATGHVHPDAWGAEEVGPDYGVFNFSELFAKALEDCTYKDVSNKRAFKNRFEFRVSDHMPIWYRFPLPPLPQGVDIKPRVK